MSSAKDNIIKLDSFSPDAIEQAKALIYECVTAEKRPSGAQIQSLVNELIELVQAHALHQITQLEQEKNDIQDARLGEAAPLPPRRHRKSRISSHP